MEGALSWTFCLLVFLCGPVVCGGVPKTVWFQPGAAYSYTYDGSTHLKGAAHIAVSAQVTIIPLQTRDDTQRCRFMVDTYDIRVAPHGKQHDKRNTTQMDFTKRMLFDMSASGEVQRVYYPRDEDAVTLTLKKILLGTLSARLEVSESQMAAGRRWAYRVNETGHEGVHAAIYQAMATEGRDEIFFRKIRQTKVIENADHGQTKTVRLNTTLGIPVKIVVTELFYSPNELAKSYKPTIPEGKEALDKGNAELNLPKMGGTSVAALTFVKAELRNNFLENEEQDLWSGMRNCSLKVEPIPPSKVDLTSIEGAIKGNISCIVKVHAAGNSGAHTGLPCFRDLTIMLARLSQDDVDKVTQQYLHVKQPRVARQTIVDVIGTAHTSECYTVMMRRVFLVKHPEAELLMRALFQLFDLSTPAPEIVMTTLDDVVFHHQYAFGDEEVTEQVNDRATLVLASVAKKVKHSHSSWANGVIQKLENRLGLHDPYHHRQLRSVMTDKELLDHLNWKTLHIHALGNAVSDSSLGHLMSYINDSNSDITLRSSAVNSLAKYNQKQVADVLLSVALTDQEYNVRLAAINGYKRHPNGGDIRTLLGPVHGRSYNMTQTEHSRMKRSFSEVVAKIWKGFHFRLEVPSIDWKKHSGGSKLGASIGLIIRNLLDLKIRPLDGHMKIDVLDSAYAIFHIGFIGYDFDLLKAEVCMKGYIGYDLNILKEYSYAKIKKLADLYNNVVKTVTGTIVTSVETFKSLVTTFKNVDFHDIVKNLITSVRQLPHMVFNLPRIGKRIFKAVGSFGDHLPVIGTVKNLVTKITTLFKDIKTDVMKLYTEISDAVNVVIPWAWKEIKTAYKGIVRAVKKLLKTPKSAIQDIAEGVARISTAMAGFMTGKKKIENANFFAKENRPYWFDIKKEMVDVWERVKSVKQALIDAMAMLISKGDDVAKRFTGIHLADMQKAAISEIKTILLEELAEPIASLKQLLQPFLKAYDFFLQIIKNFKEAWTTLVSGYNKVRTILEEIFGPKVAADFPRKLLESESCGDGFWETDGSGHYDHKGIMVEVTVNQPIVAPFRGQLKKTGPQQVTISVSSMENINIIIDNINLDVVEKEVAAGVAIGMGRKPDYCSDPHIHMAMIRRGTNEAIDPTGYLRMRDMPPPKWIQECDHFVLVWMGDTISQGSVVGLVQDDDTTPAIDGTSNNLDIDAIEDADREKRGADGLLDKVIDFGKRLGLPDLSKLKDVFNFKMDSITLNKVLGLLDKAGMSKVKTNIVKVLNEIESMTNLESCSSPETMDDGELKKALVMRGLSESGARQTLVDRYLNSDPQCFDIGSRVGKNVYCRFDKSCTSISCCVDLKLFIYRHALTTYVRYDACDLELIIGINEWTNSFKLLEEDFTHEDRINLFEDVNLLNVVQMILYLKIQRVNKTLKISVGVSWCATKSEECLSRLDIMTEAEIEIGACVNTTLPVMTHHADTPTVNEMLDMPIGDVIKLVEAAGVDENMMVQLVEDMRDAFQQWLKQQIESLMVKIFVSEFHRFDSCTTAMEKKFGPYDVMIYQLFPQVLIPLGLIFIKFDFRIDGSYGAQFRCKFCFLTMKATCMVEPQVGSVVSGSVGLAIGPLIAKLELSGYLMTSSFPTKISVGFNKFPLELRVHMDLKLIPLYLELRGLLRIEICFFLCYEKTLINKLLWDCHSPGINKNLINYTNTEPDTSPPDFGSSPEKPIQHESQQQKHSGIIPSRGACKVAQLVGRDYTDPGFSLHLLVADDRSEVELSYCIGTFSDGCDVVANMSLGGSSSVILGRMVHSVPLYFTITAENTMGLTAKTSCQLSTYDMTLPEGRITPDFSSTSHPGLLQGSALVLDDSVIITEMISAGYGKDAFGTQIIDWQTVSSIKADRRVDTGTDRLGLRLLEDFTAPREGRLIAAPVKTVHYFYVQACARACLNLPASTCLSFNYDYSTAGVCELMGHIEGHNVYVRENGLFHYFERHGIGQATSVRFSQLNLQHNTLVYFNYYLRNVLGYENIISSRGILVDFTPPSPGLILQNTSDVFRHDTCVNYVPSLWRHRCAPETALPTHRTIVDGEGSLTVFNGIEPLVDKKYTRANRVMSANWDGIHDNETGILMYLWAVGTAVCGDDVVQRTDPHKHLASKEDWTNSGTAFPLHLPDNKYYVTITAINNVEFGPLALTVCHVQPYAIDTTPPIIYAVNDVIYDEDTFQISYHVNATDPVSDIMTAEMGLGSSRRDTYICGWTKVDNYTHIQHNYRVPDGVAVWVKIRVTNHVGLRAVGHADKPIVVDNSPPNAGDVYDGDKLKEDIAFQASASKYCANWDGFGDPQSGLSRYMFAVGTSAGSGDIVPPTRLSYVVTNYCVDGLHLQHKAVYFVSVTAVNGALNERHVTVKSNGVYVDTTPPMKGVVKDGMDPTEDVKYSSEASTVASNWKLFSDPESDLKDFLVKIYRTPAGPSGKEILLHAESMEPTESSLQRHHFHLHHRDFVRVNVTATNRANTNSSVTSDGMTVDLTDPKMLELVDGDNLQHDMTYTDSTTELTCTWSFLDPESGIDHFKISAYELHEGMMTLIYPAESSWKIVPASATSWTTDEAVSLKVGARYKMRVTAVNGAGLAAVHYTNGLLVDPTPPKMLFVHAGTLLGESEELIGGYVVHNDENGIQASWGAMDGESDISEYYMGIGTAQGQTDVLALHSVGLSQGGYIDHLSLALTNATTISPVYYIMVKAVNGADKESTLMSSRPIKVVSGDVAGVVNDGPDTQLDIDYEMDVSEVTVTFSGYESERDGVSRYEWAVGSAPRLDDVMPYSYINLLEDTGSTQGMLGVGSSGKGQGQIALSAGVKYYATVRALTGAGAVLESASDGFLVDNTAPVSVIKSVAGVVLTDRATAATVIYQREVDSFTASWDVSDPESGVADVWFHLGSYPEAANIHLSTWVGNGTSLENKNVPPYTGGVPNILTLDTANTVGLTSAQVSPTLVVDTSAPLDGRVICPEFVQGGDTLECSWSGFIEKESVIEYYQFGIGKVEGDNSVYEFHLVEASVSSHKATGLKDGGLQHQETYYVTVTAVNSVGLKATAFSKPLVVDNTPPQGGRVIELPDTFIASVEATVSADTSSSQQDADAAFSSKDATCQRALTQVVVAWQPFEDEETKVTRYEVALGLTPGGTQVHGFQDVTPGALSVVIRGLDLSQQSRVFATVKGHNAAGLHSTAVSNGVYVSRISTGLEPLRHSYVYDGSDRTKDIEFQDHNDGLSAHWDVSGDPCPIEKIEWAIHKFDGTVIFNMSPLQADARQATADELPLKDGESYFVILRVTNKLGFVYTIHSNGVTVKLEPLWPGNVRDGDIIGTDLNYQPSVTSLFANWDGFGQIKRVDNGPVISKVSHVDDSIGDHLKIEHYEVAVGTDRRFPGTRNNIRPFTNAGLNLTWTFSDLSLIPLTATYYVTVRAYSISAAMVEVTSNGVKVGYVSSVVTAGTLELSKYSSSATSLSFSWSGFKFQLPVKMYYWGMGTSVTELASLSCDLVVRQIDGDSAVQHPGYSHLFDIHPLTNVGLDTYIQMTDLILEQGATYRVVVIAVDESGGCVESSDLVTVDTTPPFCTEIGVGPHTEMELLYASSSTSLTMWWTCNTDTDSGIKDFKVRLLTGLSCTNDTKRTTIVDWTQLSPNSTSYDFTHLNLQEFAVYFVELLTTNGADLEHYKLSRPILLDVDSPVAGAVKHGHNFKESATFQDSVTHIQGVFLYVPSTSAQVCSQRTYEMTASDLAWMPLVHKYLHGFQQDRQDGIAFRDYWLDYTQDGLSVVLRREVRNEQMSSAALQADAGIETGGIYSFDIQAASGDLRAVTSVAFFDGPKGVFVDYTPVVFDGDSQRLADSGIRSNGLRILKPMLPGDTAVNLPEEKMLNAKGFGFQIVPNASYNGHTADWIMLWSAKSNKTSHTVSELRFDPTERIHRYKVIINEDTAMFDKVNWEYKLYVDGKQEVLLVGTPVSRDAHVTVGVYNRHGWVVPLDNVFSPPETTAYFRSFTFPPSSTELCRYGDPFQGGSQPVVEFQAAVGSTAHSQDIATFRKISRPCLPCKDFCDQAVCTPSCRGSATQVIHFDLGDLTLDPWSTVSSSNTTLLQPYFVMVKAITGSGRSVTVVSAGVCIDTTPPVIQTMFHIDFTWSKLEPSSYQGDNTTIAVYYEAVDLESEVVETWWAIGSSPGDTDVQPFVNIGTRSFVSNTSLEGMLFDGHTYYVTLRCINGAGLVTTNSTQGVTIKTMSPSVDNVTTATEDTEPFSDTAAEPAVKTSCQDSIGVKWDKPPEDANVDGIYFSVGSEGGSDDVYPEEQVGFGEFGGGVRLTSGGIKLSGEGNNTSRRKRDIDGSFYMEPGRTLRIHLRACSQAHKCSEVPIKPMLIVRDTDSVGKTEAGELTLRLETSGDTKHTVTVKATKSQSPDKMLTGGVLSDDDLAAHYQSGMSDSFKSFIVNPESTRDKTDRYLKKRIHRWDGTTVFVSTLPDQTIDGPLSITMPFDKTRVEDFMQDIYPRILRWCADEEMWIDAGRTCDTDDSNRHIDWAKGLVTVKVCHSSIVCDVTDKKQHRRKRAAQISTVSGPAMYSVANTNKNFVNLPPYITSQTSVNIFENDRIQFTLKAADSEDDPLSFLLNETAPAPMGNVSLELNGKLTYTPCVDCYGEDAVYFTVWEKRTDGEPPLSVESKLVINIENRPDSPKLQLFHKGHDVIPPSSVITVTVEENNEKGSTSHDITYVLAAYDPDYTDNVSLMFDPPQHGDLTQYRPITKVTLTEQDCSQPWDIRRPLWDKLTNTIASSATAPEVSLPNPCGTDFMNRHLVWVVTTLKYRPFKGYFGEDIFKVIAEDGTGRDLLTLKVYVLKNPCVNQGICVGPETDPECTSTNRSTVTTGDPLKNPTETVELVDVKFVVVTSVYHPHFLSIYSNAELAKVRNNMSLVLSFSGYICHCPNGYNGDYCETDIDECLSSPCPTNYSCVNRVGSYECFCNPKWPCHVTDPLLQLWQVVMVSVGGIVFVILLVLAAVAVFCRKLETKSSRGTSRRSLASESTMGHGPFRGRWLYGSPALEDYHQRQFVNPAFNGAHSLDYRLPDVYGHHNDYNDLPTANTRPTPLNRQPVPRIPSPKKPLFRPMRRAQVADPRPDYY